MDTSRQGIVVSIVEHALGILLDSIWSPDVPGLLVHEDMLMITLPFDLLLATRSYPYFIKIVSTIREL